MTIDPKVPSKAATPGGALLSTPDRQAIPAAFLAGYFGTHDGSPIGGDGPAAPIPRVGAVSFSSHPASTNAKSKSDSSVSGAVTRSPFTPRNGPDHKPVNHDAGSLRSIGNGGGGAAITPLHRRSLGLPSSTPNCVNEGRGSPRGHYAHHIHDGSIPWMPSSVTRFFGKAGRANRASQLGLSPHHALHRSFEANQSFPRALTRAAGAPPLDLPEDPEVLATPAPFPRTSKDVAGLILSTKPALSSPMVAAVDGIHGVSFSSPQFHGTFEAIDGAAASTSVFNHSLGRSWSFLHFLQPRSSGKIDITSTPGSPRLLPTVQMAVKNPNKAVLTIDKLTTKILIANDMAGDLFGIPTEQLVGSPLTSILDPTKMRSKGAEAVSESLVDAVNGDTLTLSGKVIDVVHAATGVSMSVSVWVQEIPSSTKQEPDQEAHSSTTPSFDRCIVILEPVDRLTARVDIDSDGFIRGLDDEALQLLGFETRDMVLGRRVDTFLHSIQYPRTNETGQCDSITTTSKVSNVSSIPKSMKKQHATAVSKSGITFPVSLVLENYREDLSYDGILSPTSSSSASVSPFPVYSIFLWVFANISGLLTFDSSGIITGYNNFFVLSFLGYDESQLLGLPVTAILPQFFEDLVGSDDDQRDRREKASDGDDDGIDDSSWPMPPDLNPHSRDAVIPHLANHPQHGRSETDELIAAADVFVHAAKCNVGNGSSSISAGVDESNSRACLASENDADCEDNGDDGSESATKSTLFIDSGEHQVSTQKGLEEKEISQETDDHLPLYSPTMPDRPYSPTDPPYSPIPASPAGAAHDESPSLLLDCSESDFDTSHVSVDRPAIAQTSFLPRPAAPTPAKWSAVPSDPLSTTATTALNVSLPVEKGRDSDAIGANPGLGAALHASRTPKRESSAMLKLVEEEKDGESSQLGPYSPSEPTQEIQLSPLGMTGDAHIVENEVLSPLSDWNSSVVVFEENKNMSPSHWKSGSVSTYVNVPSPYCEKEMKGGIPVEKVAASQATDASSVPPARRETIDSIGALDSPLRVMKHDGDPTDESRKVLLSSSFFSEEKPPIHHRLPPDPPTNFLSQLTQSMSSMTLSTSTPAKESFAITDPSPVRRRLALDGGVSEDDNVGGVFLANEEVTPRSESEVGAALPQPAPLDIADGNYCGRATHRNGTTLGALYQIKKIETSDAKDNPSAKVVYCMWLSKDPKDWLEISQHQQQLLRRLGSRDASSILTPGSGCSSRAHSRGGRGPGLANLTLNSTRNDSMQPPTDKSEDALADVTAGSEVIAGVDESTKTVLLDERVVVDDEEADGEISRSPIRAYQREYETLQSIGKGAYGYVKLARRRCDALVVVVKSIKKGKINYPGCWRHDEELERTKGLAKVPLEVS